MKLLEEIENIKSQDLSLSELANRIENAMNDIQYEYSRVTLDQDKLAVHNTNKIAYEIVLVNRLQAI